MQGQLKEYVEKKYDSFVLYFNSSLVGQDINDIHQLRVTIKELRALWMLIEWASQKTYKKAPHFSSISPLFKKAGQLREAQVNYSMVQNMRTSYMKYYKEHLIDVQEITVVHLLVTMESFDLEGYQKLNKGMYEAIDNLTPLDFRKSIVEIILQKSVKIENLRKSLPNDKKLHKIRTHLKVIKELFQIMKTLNLTKGLEKLRNQNITICRYMGEWHDHVVLLHSLQALDISLMSKGNTRYFQNFIHRIKVKEENKKNIVMTKLNNYLQAQNSARMLRLTL